MSLSSTVTADIAVLGAGPSGLTAAHTAALAGADVVIIDATGELGGNGAFSSGYMAFAGTSLQREQALAGAVAIQNVEVEKVNQLLIELVGDV